MIKTLGRLLRELREAHDLSLRELGAKVHASAAFLSDVELGRRHPSEKMLKDLARVLHTTTEDFEAHDTRAPVDDLRRLATENPVYGLAFRRLVDSGIGAEELLKLVEQRSGKKK